MKVELIFPVVIIMMFIGAGAVYGFKGDFPRMGYWFFAAGLNTSLIFVK